MDPFILGYIKMEMKIIKRTKELLTPRKNLQFKLWLSTKHSNVLQRQ